MRDFLRLSMMLLMLPLLQGCGGAAEDADTGPKYLDSVFVDGAYRETLDALRHDATIAAVNRKAIRPFIVVYRSRSPKGWTYGKILEASKGMENMRERAVEMEVVNFMRKEDMLLHEFYLS